MRYDSISSLASFDWLANIIASLTVHLCCLAHGMVSDAAILRTDARLAAAMRRKRLARGVLTPIKRTREGKVFYCLQYGRKGRHVSRYVAAEEADAYREATENYRRFMDAVDAYVEEASARTAAPAGLSFGCANVQVCKPPAPVSSTNVAINWRWC